MNIFAVNCKTLTYIDALLVNTLLKDKDSNVKSLYFSF